MSSKLSDQRPQDTNVGGVAEADDNKLRISAQAEGRSLVRRKLRRFGEADLPGAVRATPCSTMVTYVSYIDRSCYNLADRS